MGSAPSKRRAPLNVQPGSASLNNSNRKSIKVPLHVALRAIVLIQKRVRVRIATKRLEKLKLLKAEEDGAAMKYLTNMKEKLDILKLSPIKQHANTNKFSAEAALFNNNEFITTINGSKINVDDYYNSNKLSNSTVLIIPLVGFVVKSKTLEVGRKVFINICHHELIQSRTMKYTSPRLLQNSESDNGNYELNFENVLIFDVLMSSDEFHINFKYKPGLGVVPVNAKIKNKFSEQAIDFLNSFDHSSSSGHHYKQLSNGSTVKSIKGSANKKGKSKSKKHELELMESTDFQISSAFKLPKIKRGYIGDFGPLVLDTESSQLFPYHSRPVDKPAKTAASAGGHRGGVKLSPPPLVRNWVALPTEQQVQLLGSSAAANMFTRESFSLSKSEVSDFQTEYEEKYSESGNSPPKGKRLRGDYDDDELDELGGRTADYFKQLNQLQCGLAAYVVLQHGTLTIYNTANTTSTNNTNSTVNNKASSDKRQGSRVINPSPFGKDEFLSVMLYNYHVSTSIDSVNNIYYLQLLANTSPTTPGVPDSLSMFFNRFSSGAAAESEVSIQCKSYGEMLAWKMLLVSHIDFSLRLLQILNNATNSINNGFGKDTLLNAMAINAQPIKKSGWLVRRSVPDPELSGALMQQKVFAVVASGVMNLYANDSSEDSLMETVPLAHKTIEVVRSVPNARTGTFDVLFAIRNVANFEVWESVYEFAYFMVNERDEEPLLMIDALTSNIAYATNFTYLYMLPVLEFNHRMRMDNKAISLLPMCIEVSRYSEYETAANDDRLGAESEDEEELNNGENDNELNSDDDVSVKEAVIKRLQSERAEEEAKLKVNRPKEHIFRCIGTTKDYKNRTDRNLFANPVNVLCADNHYDLVLVDNRVFLYKSLCHVATLNIEPENIELVSPPLTHAEELSAAIATATKEAHMEGIQSAAAAVVEPPVIYTAWQIVLIATNSVKYRLRFQSEGEFLHWLRIVDKNNECPENNVVVPLPSPTKSVKKSKGKKLRSSGNNEGDSKESDDDDEDDDADEEFSDLIGVDEGKGDSDDDGDNDKSKEDEVTLPEIVRSNSKTAATLASFQNRLNIKGTNPVDSTANNVDNNATKKYSRLLRANEKVIASGVVLKHEAAKKTPGAFSAANNATRRILLLTDTPRMIFIDAVSSIIRGHIELKKDHKIQYKTTSAMDFEITVAGSQTKFTASDSPDKDAKFWVYKLKVATGK